MDCSFVLIICKRPLPSVSRTRNDIGSETFFEVDFSILLLSYYYCRRRRHRYNKLKDFSLESAAHLPGDSLINDHLNAQHGSQRTQTRASQRLRLSYLHFGLPLPGERKSRWTEKRDVAFYR